MESITKYCILVQLNPLAHVQLLPFSRELAQLHTERPFRFQNPSSEKCEPDHFPQETEEEVGQKAPV